MFVIRSENKRVVAAAALGAVHAVNHVAVGNYLRHGTLHNFIGLLAEKLKPLGRPVEIGDVDPAALDVGGGNVACRVFDRSRNIGFLQYRHRNEFFRSKFYIGYPGGNRRQPAGRADGDLHTVDPVGRLFMQPDGLPVPRPLRGAVRQQPDMTGVDLPADEPQARRVASCVIEPYTQIIPVSRHVSDVEFNRGITKVRQLRKTEHRTPEFVAGIPGTGR